MTGILARIWSHNLLYLDLIELLPLANGVALLVCVGSRRVMRLLTWLPLDILECQLGNQDLFLLGRDCA